MDEIEKAKQAALRRITQGRAAEQELAVVSDIIEGWIGEITAKVFEVEAAEREPLVVEVRVLKGLLLRLNKAVQSGRNAELIRTADLADEDGE